MNDRLRHEEYIDSHQWMHDNEAEVWWEYHAEVVERKSICRCPECQSNKVYSNGYQVYCKKCGLVICE